MSILVRETSGILRLHRKRDVTNYNRIMDLHSHFANREKFHDVSSLEIVRKFLAKGRYCISLRYFHESDSVIYKCDFQCKEDSLRFLH